MINYTFNLNDLLFAITYTINISLLWAMFKLNEKLKRLKEKHLNTSLYTDLHDNS